jgi:hypothetical protein
MPDNFVPGTLSFRLIGKDPRREGCGAGSGFALDGETR